uniref:Uncharacterized protein n=1 Tax=Romanomermis culicivorax TaxID=13658 RepID=A0A915K776_ROMCU
MRSKITVDRKLRKLEAFQKSHFTYNWHTFMPTIAAKSPTTKETGPIKMTTKGCYTHCIDPITSQVIRGLIY